MQETTSVYCFSVTGFIGSKKELENDDTMDAEHTKSSGTFTIFPISEGKILVVAFVELVFGGKSWVGRSTDDSS